MTAKDILSMLLDNVLALTIVLIILTSIINAFIRYRSRDKCLKDFNGFFVTLPLKNGKTIRGKMKLLSSSMELEYQQPENEEQDGYCRNSYIMMNDELEADIQAIHRYHWDLTPKNKRLREKSIKRSYKPNLFRRTGRTMRNAVNTLRDAFEKKIGKTLPAGETLLLPLDKTDEIKDLKLILKRGRYIDLIAPRSLARVRYGGKKEKLSFKELIGIDDLSMPFKIKRMRN